MQSMRIPYLSIWAATALLTGLSCPSDAHNGAAAIAVPVEGITIDGDLSDWPEDMVRYPILFREFGEPLKGQEDFQGVFRVGYQPQENALYVAVEVEDESVVKETRGAVSWNTQETCEIYVEVSHNSGNISQYYLWGSTRGAWSGKREDIEDIEDKVQWEEGAYV